MSNQRALTFDVTWVDVSRYLAVGQQPAFVIPRPETHGQSKPWAGPTDQARVGTFYVPKFHPFDQIPPDETRWVFTRRGEMVRVPVWAFKTVARGRAALFGLGVQIGAEVLAGFARDVGVPPVCVHLLLGHDVTDLHPEDAERAYVGVAIRTE